MQHKINTLHIDLEGVSTHKHVSGDASSYLRTVHRRYSKSRYPEASGGASPYPGGTKHLQRGRERNCLPPEVHSINTRLPSLQPVLLNDHLMTLLEADACDDDDDEGDDNEGDDLDDNIVVEEYVQELQQEQEGHETWRRQCVEISNQIYLHSVLRHEAPQVRGQ